MGALLWGQPLVWLEKRGINGELLEVRPAAISADGQIVVGTMQIQNEGGFRLYRAFRWTKPSGLEDLGTLGGEQSRGFGVSADGSTIVGHAQVTSGYYHAFRYKNGEMTDLGVLNIDFHVESTARATSMDGKVIIGQSNTPGGAPVAFIWREGQGMTHLGNLNTGHCLGHYAYAITPDTSVIVGMDINLEAILWTGLDDCISLGTLTPQGRQSEAYGISDNGRVVVGASQINSVQWRAFRWTAGRGMEDLGVLPGDTQSGYYVAYDASYSGDTIVGEGDGKAFIWIRGVGLQDLNMLFASLLRPGEKLVSARAITPDGRYITGIGYKEGGRNGFLTDMRNSVFFSSSFSNDSFVRYLPDGWLIYLGKPLEKEIEYVIYTIPGIVYLKSKYNPQVNGETIFISNEGLPSGVYFLRLGEKSFRLLNLLSN